MNNELLQIMAIISKVTTLVDGGAKVTLDTNEMAPQQMTKLFSLKGKSGWMVFKENPVTLEDIPEIDADPDEGGKTPGQRLRARMYVYFEKELGRKTDFPTWYAGEMERIGQRYLEKLE